MKNISVQMSSYPLNIFNNYYVLAASFLACLIILFYSIFTSAKAVLGAGLERCVILQAALQQKWWADFIEAWCYDSVYQSKELVNFWWWSGTGYGFRISFPFPSPSWRRFISIFSYSLRSISRHSAKWLTPTRQWIYNILGASRQTSGFEFCITFGWDLTPWQTFVGGLA